MSSPHGKRNGTHLLGNVGRYEMSFERGEGVWLVDTEGERYLDFLGGVAVCALGHAHPALTGAIQDQAAKLLHVSNLFHTPQIDEAADLLVAKLGDGRVYFCNSGTEANEAAIKGVRKHAWRNGEQDRNEIVALEGSFHGRTYGALAATIQPAKWQGFDPMPQGFVSVPLNDVDALDAAVGDNTAAVMIEPIQGEGGIRPMTEEFASAARRITSERGAALIVDEIQTGVGRTGRWFGFEHFGIAPDVVTLAKALGSGFPVGATWFSPRYAGALQPGDHSTTQGGGPLACAALIATLQAIDDEGLVENAARMGKLLAESVRPLGIEVRGEGLLIGLELELLAESVRPLGIEVRGEGLLIGLELGEPRANDVVRRALDRRLIVNDVTPSTIRLAPPLIVSEAEINLAVERLTAAVVA